MMEGCYHWLTAALALGERMCQSVRPAQQQQQQQQQLFPILDKTPMMRATERGSVAITDHSLGINNYSISLRFCFLSDTNREVT
ncbi:hypothetical protein RRG08_027832 [Elysia crispata]|uniref:Uncharacterized protein n=1 Tax=Elysia crispata TaxID=231223 RepID=A0AAE1BCE4_9GAST|nr:hypothetical protein RRG08_027832 [Elysia crispata]